MRFPGFIGPSSPTRAETSAFARTVNLYPEVVESGDGKNRAVFHGTPGTKVFATLDDAPLRALLEAEGRLFAVAGASFYEVESDGTWIVLGEITRDTPPAVLVANGKDEGDQILILSGGDGYIYNRVTDVFEAITDPDFPADARMAAFCDGYFVVLDVANNQFRFSALKDGLAWNGLDVGRRSSSADALVAMVLSQKELYFFGSKTGEPWYDAGAANFPFAPVAQATIEQGIAAPWSLHTVDNAVMWVGRSKDGDRIVYRAEGYQAVRVSTHALEEAMRRYTTVADAEAWSYMEGGHTFYVLWFPTGDATWVYDAATQLWHERTSFDQATGKEHAHRGRCHAHAFGTHFVGDRESGVIYEMGLDLLDDAAVPIRRWRQYPHLHAEQRRIIYDELALEAEMGVGTLTGQGSDPQVMLQYSDDGGKTWGHELWVSLGPRGQYNVRAVWYQLGQSRNRVFRLVQTDPVKLVWTDAYLRVRSEAA